MIAVPAGVRIVVAARPGDFRNGLDGLAALVQQALHDTERSQILRALEEANGVIGGPNGAAARLGIKRTTLHVRMQKLGIHVSRTAIDERRGTS